MGVITYLWTNFDYLSTGFDRLLIKSVGLLEEMNAFPGIAQSVGLLFATILVAIAIMLFSKEKDFYVLDRNLILDHVIKTERFLVGIGLIFFPLFFWEVAKGEIRFFIIFLWCLGVCYMIAILVNSYCWMKKNKFEIRFNYLRDTKNLKDVGGSWNSIWETGDISILNEIRFFEIFSFKIDSFLKNIKTLDIASELLDDFDLLIKNRSVHFLTFDLDLKKILNWHVKSWEETEDKKKEINIWSKYNKILIATESILRIIEGHVLRDRNSLFFFKELEKHTEVNRKKEYLGDLFYVVCNNFFGNVKNFPMKGFKLWEHEFPPSWKVTKENLKNKENVLAMIWLDIFFEWIGERILKPIEGLDQDAENVVRNLFPDIDTALWSRFLILSFLPYTDGERIKSVIEHPWNFGIMSYRIPNISLGDSEEVISKSLSKILKTTKKNTIEFIYSIPYFKNHFSVKKLKELQTEASDLQYKEDPKKEKKRIYLLKLLREMEEFLDETSK